MIDTRTPTERLRECLEAADYAAFDAEWSTFGRAIVRAAELHRIRRAQAVSLTAPMSQKEAAE